MNNSFVGDRKYSCKMHHQTLCFELSQDEEVISVVLSTRTIRCIAGGMTYKYNDRHVLGNMFSIENSKRTLNDAGTAFCWGDDLVVLQKYQYTDELCRCW